MNLAEEEESKDSGRRRRRRRRFLQIGAIYRKDDKLRKEVGTSCHHPSVDARLDVTAMILAGEMLTVPKPCRPRSRWENV